MDPTALVAALQYFSALSIARGLGKLSRQRERMETSNDNEGHGEMKMKLSRQGV
jgi:hypothetical protein